jgi:hypothetical protein
LGQLAMIARLPKLVARVKKLEERFAASEDSSI